MSPSPHLQAAQFGTAKEQGKPVSDWLASDEGHEWQDQFTTHSMGRVNGSYAIPEIQNSSLGANGFFSLKEDNMDDALANYDAPRSETWEMYGGSHRWAVPLDREAEDELY